MKKMLLLLTIASASCITSEDVSPRDADSAILEKVASAIAAPLDLDQSITDFTRSLNSSNASDCLRAGHCEFQAEWEFPKIHPKKIVIRTLIDFSPNDRSVCSERSKIKSCQLKMISYLLTENFDSSPNCVPSEFIYAKLPKKWTPNFDSTMRTGGRVVFDLVEDQSFRLIVLSSNVGKCFKGLQFFSY